MPAVLILAILATLPANRGWAQDPPSVPQPTTPGLPPFGRDVEYLIGPGDIVRISVYGNDDLNQTVVVQSDGTFLFPLIGRVKAEDLNVKELERKVTILLGQRFIRDPQVTVLLQDYKSKVVYVLGGAARPGSYSLFEARTILDVAARAGIPNTAQIQVVRPLGTTTGPLLPVQVVPPSPAAGAGGMEDESTGDDGAPAEGEPTEGEPAAPLPIAEIILVSMRDIQSGDLTRNIALRANDTIFVVEADKVYVSGEVGSPGGYSPPVDATVERMVLLAGGFTTRASRGRIELERDVDGKRTKKSVRLEDPVLPGDKIRVKAKLF